MAGSSPIGQDEIFEDVEAQPCPSQPAAGKGRHRPLSSKLEGCRERLLFEAAPELVRAVRGEQFRLIPRCVITQSSGKQRVIDK